MGSGKPKGIRAGRKLATKRRLQKWNDKDYYCALDLKIPSWAAVWPRVLSFRRLVLNQNSRTPLSEKVSE